MEYPTKTEWTMWYDCQAKRNLSSENYSSCLNEISTIDDLPQLLYLLDNLEKASAWPLNSNVHFFRRGIQPLWEDKANMKGGKWMIEIPKGFGTVNNEIISIWERTILYAASEMVAEKGICGCVLSPRRSFDRIALWTKDTDEDVVDIGKEWKKVVGYGKELAFKVHENAMKGFRERNNNLYTLA